MYRITGPEPVVLGRLLAEQLLTLLAMFAGDGGGGTGEALRQALPDGLAWRVARSLWAPGAGPAVVARRPGGRLRYLALDDRGRLYASDGGAHVVVRWPVPPLDALRAGTVGIDPPAVVAGQANRPGTGAHQLRMPSGIAVAADADGGTLYVADSDNDRVVAWDPGAAAGRVLAGIDAPGPADVKLAPAAGSGSPVLLVLGQDGPGCWALHEDGAALLWRLDRFFFPGAAAALPCGDVYVVEQSMFGGGEVAVIRHPAAAGPRARTVVLDETAGLQEPYGLWVDPASREIFFTDYAKGAVLLRFRPGQQVGDVLLSAEDKGEARLTGPTHGLCGDPATRTLYVADVDQVLAVALDCPQRAPTAPL